MRISTAGIARKQDRYFLALRKPGTSIGEVWEFPGGKNRYGESPEKTLEREFLEELNANISVDSLVYEGSFFNKGTEYKQLAFFVEFLTDDFVLEEHQCYGWFLLSEMASLNMADSDKLIMDTLIQKQEN